MYNNFEGNRYLAINIEDHCRVPDKEWSFQDGGL